MTESARAMKLCTVALVSLTLFFISGISQRTSAAESPYTVRVYRFARGAELNSGGARFKWPVATDGHGNVAFLIDEKLETRAVVWSTDGSITNITPPRVDLDKAFRIYNIGTHGEHYYPTTRIDEVAFFRNDLAVTNSFSFAGL